MNVALIQNSQHDVHRDDGRENQERLTRQRILKGCSRSLERGVDARRHLDFFLHFLDGPRGIAQRASWCEVERQSDHRKLSLMVDGERCIRRLHLYKSGKRNRGPAGGCCGGVGRGCSGGRGRATGANVDVVHRVGGLGKVRQDLQHHVILVQLREDDRNLPLAEGVIQSVVDGLGKDSQPRRGITVDREGRPEAAVEFIRGYIAQFRRRAQFFHQLRCP